MSENNKTLEAKTDFPCLVDGCKRKSFPLQGMVYLFLSPDKSVNIHSSHILKMIEKGLEEWGLASDFMKTPD